MKGAPFLIFLLTVGAADARPYTYASKTKYAEVDYSWSAEAGAVPALVRKFKAELANDLSRTKRCGKMESQIRIQTGGSAIACSSSTKIITRGETARLLSLVRGDYAFTGGAHGNGGTIALLWDRKRGRQIAFPSLFIRPDGYAPALRTAYCDALDRERKKRRWDGYQAGVVAEFDSCPNFSELALIPSGSPRLSQVHLIAAPYVAGSYAEGEYDIPLPVTPALIAALKPEYRASFSAQRQ